MNKGLENNGRRRAMALLCFIATLALGWIHIHLAKGSGYVSVTVWIVVLAAILTGYKIGQYANKGKQLLLSDLDPDETYQVISMMHRSCHTISRKGYIIELAVASERLKGSMHGNQTLLLKLDSRQICFSESDEFVTIAQSGFGYVLTNLDNIRQMRPTKEEEVA